MILKKRYFENYRDSKGDNYQILMTEKDYMRIEDFKFNEIDYVRLI